MVKKNGICVFVSAVIMLFLPWCAVTFIKGDGAMAACFLLFYAINLKRNQNAERLIAQSKRIYMTAFLLTAGLCAGCGKEGTAGNDPSTEVRASQAEEQSDSASRENDDTERNDKLELDFSYDYSEDIKADVDDVVSNSASLQEELENIEKIIQKYTPLAEAAQTQIEMNVSSKWFFIIWDTELNNLWNRFSNSANPQTKEKILAEQRNWIAMKEEVTLLSIGSSEENGSMYPLLQNSFLEEITRNRSYVLANELARINGEFFVMPERSAKYGLFVDNQRTDNVYSFLITQQGWDGNDEAVISIYRQGEARGTFIDNGNGELTFTSDDGSIKGIIIINRWNGANFKVTETSGESVFSAGEEVEFPFAF